MSLAQAPQPERAGVAPAHVALVEGAASLEREGRADNNPLNMPLLSGDRLRTSDGRVEVRFADGSTLHLDLRTTIDVQSDDLVRLTEGRVRLSILGPLDGAQGTARTVAYRVDSPAGSIRITQPGEYRIALLHGTDETQLELAVVRGAGDVFTDQGSTPVRAGERAYASAGLAPSYPYAYNSASWDAFDRWSESRRDVRLGVSTEYLPDDMQTYAPLLDESGDWRYAPSYGYVWYPRVAADWRPYYYGRWASYPRYGWTWIGADRFAWPTHHYGRWGFSAGVWFWIPSSRWAPAYVSWGYAPGYVSWCPLGFDNRPVIAIDLSRVGPGSSSPWRAWTAVSYSHFGSRDSYVNQRAVNWDRLDRGQRPRFETRPSAPASREVAVPRHSTPIRWAGSRNLPPEGGSHGISRGDDAQSREGGNSGISRANGAAPRDGSARAGSSRDGSWLPPSGGRTNQPARESATPRYVNRGDEIIRSQTERPTPRAASPSALPAREGYVTPGPSTLREPQDRPEPSRGAAGAEGAPSRAETRGVETRTIPEGPARPSYQPYQPRGYEPRSRPALSRVEGPTNEAPSAGTPAPSREVAPRAYERPRPGDEPRPAPQRQPPMPERAAPVERAPSRSEGRQPPPERAAPPERSAPRETAVPRGGGRALEEDLVIWRS
jgi:hypothetical protein